MGHYRADMVNEEEENRKAAERELDYRFLAERIERDVRERGVGRVLADILGDAHAYKRDRMYRS